MLRIFVILRDDYVSKDDKVPVLLKIYLNRKRICLPTGIKIEPGNWNSEKSRVKGNSKDAKDKNLIISVCVSRLNDIIVRYRLQNKILTPDLLRSEYQNPSIFLDFHDFCKRELALKKGVEQPATIMAHSSALEKLKNYRTSLMFSEIDYSFITGFYRYMKVDLKNKDSTAAKTLTVIKSYLNMAVKKKIIDVSPYPGDLKLKKSLVSRVYLLPEEFTKLVKIYRNNHLHLNKQKVLKYFLFSCIAGLRISDVKSITWNNIMTDCLVYTPVKTKSYGKMVRVPLCRFGYELIGTAETDKRKRVFETYTDQVTNRYLKSIADLCGIEKKITTHTGRHTFATLFLRHSKNIAGLQELMGHSNIAQTMVYAHIIYDDLKTEMDIFDTLANEKFES